MKTSRMFFLAALLLIAAIPASAQLNDTYVIPAAANQGGAFGTNWLTQFSIFNPHLDHDLWVSVVFIPQGGGTGIEEMVLVPSNSLAYSDNILGDLFEIRGAGALLVATFPEDNPTVPNQLLQRSFLVTSSTYNDSRDGTFGSTIPGTFTGLLDYNYDNISGIVQNVRDDARTGWRTNFGAVNLGRCEVELIVNVYDADGRTVRENITRTIKPLAHMQDRLPVEIEAGTVEFFVQDPCSANDDLYAVVFPYTSTIDVLSGDPKYQVPTLLALAGDLVPEGKVQTQAQAARVIDPTQFGKKIDISYVRGVREAAMKGDKHVLVKDGRGYRLAR